MVSGMTSTAAPSPTIPISAAAATPRSRGSLRSFVLPGPAGSLEAQVNEGAPDAPFAAVVCHPHPLGGGTMHNKVVYHAMKALNDPAWGLGWPVLRFNFRGTGLSQGTHDGETEAGDVLTALDWLENEYHRPLVVVGFSFGAAMALAACCGAADKKVRAIAALGLPLVAIQATEDSEPSSDFSALVIACEGRDYRYPSLADCPIPKLFLSGDLDQYASAEALAQTVDSAAEPKRLLLIAGADHFFTGQLEPMQSALTGWLKEQLMEQMQ
jgi:alpha/beta superfamily hydrolase